MSKYVYRPKYSSDFTRWYPEFSALNGKPRDQYQANMTALQEKIIANNDAAMAYYFACDIGHQNYKMQQVIIKSKSAQYGILFAINIINADINALQKMILESNDLEAICQLACYVPNVNIKKIQSIILNNPKSKKNAKWAHMLLKHVPEINPNKFKQVIFDSKKPRYLFELAKHLKNKKELLLIQDLIINSKSPTYIRMFAEKFDFADVERLEQAVLDSGDTKEIKRFALYVKRSKMRNFIILS